MRKARLALALAIAALGIGLATPAVSEAAGVSGQIECTWSGCGGAGYGAFTNFHVGGGDGTGCDYVYNNNGWYMDSVYCDDTLPNLGGVVAYECSRGYRLVMVARAAFNWWDNYGCGGRPYTYSVTLAEAYPFWSDYPGQYPPADHGRAYSIDLYGTCSTWGYITQGWDFGWPAGIGPAPGWNSPAPTYGQAVDEAEWYANNCGKLGLRYRMADGNWGSGIQAIY